jgi:hypothetical protein
MRKDAQSGWYLAMLARSILQRCSKRWPRWAPRSLA